MLSRRTSLVDDDNKESTSIAASSRQLIGSLFGTPGSSLTGTDKEAFANIKKQVKLSIAESLPSPDFIANVNCCNAVLSVINTESHSNEILREVVFLLCKKLTSSVPKTDLLLLTLIETLMNTCGEDFHHAINCEYFVKTLSRVVNSYKMERGDAKLVFNLAIDLIQCWGEAFYTRSKEYQHLVHLYDTLQRENVPFKSLRDNTHAPMTSKETPTERKKSFSPQSTKAPVPDPIITRRNSYAPTRALGNPMQPKKEIAAVQSPFGGSALPPKGSSGPSLPDAAIAIEATATLLKELILSSNTSAEVRSNDIALELEDALRGDQNKLSGIIQREVASSGSHQHLPALIALHDEVADTLRLFDDVVSNKLPMHYVKAQYNDKKLGETASGPTGAGAPPNGVSFDPFGLSPFGEVEYVVAPDTFDVLVTSEDPITEVTPSGRRESRGLAPPPKDSGPRRSSFSNTTSTTNNSTFDFLS